MTNSDRAQASQDTDGINKKLLYVLVGVAIIVATVHIISLFLPRRESQVVAVPTFTRQPRPTDTPASTEIPPTATETATPSFTATPAPVSVLDRVPIDNGEWGENYIYCSVREEKWIEGSDGNHYRVGLGFLSRPESVSQTQDFWEYARRGGGNWQMSIQVRTDQNWTHCTADDNVCHETSVSHGEPRLSLEIYLQDRVWSSLLDDWIDRGWQATTNNPYYQEIQTAIFNTMCNCEEVPTEPCVGFAFSRVD